MTVLLVLARAVIRSLSWLPQRVLNTLAKLFGYLAYYLPWQKNRIIRQNLALCFPDWSGQERDQLHRRYLFELFRLIFEAPVIWHWQSERIESAIEIVRGEKFLDPLANNKESKPKGTLYVSGHFGNWELVNLRLSMHQPITTLYRAPKNKRLDNFINQPRRRFGAIMVPGDRAALKHLLKALRSGEAAAIAPDIQPKGGDGLFVPFFGIETLTMTLVHKLARKTGCRVVLTDLKRNEKGDGWFMTLIDATQQLQTDDTAQALTHVNQWLENCIKKDPAHYLWLYKRFSKRPEGEAPRYVKD